MECDRDGHCDNYRCQDITCTPARSILLLLSPCGYAQLVVRSYLTYTKGRANQWTECPACTFIRQCIEEVSNTKRFHASLGSAAYLQRPVAQPISPLTLVWSEEFTPGLPDPGEHSGHRCNGWPGGPQRRDLKCITPRLPIVACG